MNRPWAHHPKPATNCVDGIMYGCTEASYAAIPERRAGQNGDELNVKGQPIGPEVDEEMPLLLDPEEPPWADREQIRLR